jgi:hypothetical protein
MLRSRLAYISGFFPIWSIRQAATRWTVIIRVEKMSDDEVMQVDDEDVMPIKSKGKGKAAVSGDADDNLPW